MPYCPECRDEYVEGIVQCPDCEMDLVGDLTAVPEPREPEPEPGDDTPAVAVVYRPTSAGAQAAVAQLLSFSVPARVGVPDSGVDGSIERFPIEVPPEYAATAARILRHVPAGEDEDSGVRASDVALLELSQGALRREGDGAVAGLVRLLVRGQGEVVTCAAARLARLPGAGVAALGEALVEAVAGDSGPITAAAVKALRTERRPGLPPGLAGLARDERPEVRVRTIRAMAGLGGSDSVPHAVALLRDEVEGVREEAADAIWELSQGRIDLDLDLDSQAVEEDIRILEDRYGG